VMLPNALSLDLANMLIQERLRQAAAEAQVVQARQAGRPGPRRPAWRVPLHLALVATRPPRLRVALALRQLALRLDPTLVAFESSR
jgi:hypothetical protein